MIRSRGAVLVLVALSIGCATTSLQWSPEQVSKGSNVKYMVSLVKPMSPVSQVIGLVGIPALRASLYVPALVKNSGEIPPHLQNIEFYGYVTGPTEITRLAIVNGYLVARDTITLPTVIYAEQSPTVAAPPIWSLPSGVAPADLISRVGAPQNRATQGSQDILMYGGKDNIELALVENNVVTRAFAVRGEPVAGARVDAIMAEIAGFLGDEGQMERMIAEVIKNTSLEEMDRMLKKQ